MKITRTKFKDLIIIKQEKFIDYRGELRITYRQKDINYNKFFFEYVVTSKKKRFERIAFSKKISAS